MNVLIIGLGSVASKHIKALKKIGDRINLYAYRSRSNQYTIPGVKDIFSLENIELKFDFAIISNPTHLHSFFIELLSDKGISLLIEKPPLDSLRDVEKLLKKIDKSNIITYVGCNLRFHPSLVFLKKFISLDNQRINEVNIYSGSYLPNWRPEKDFREIYSANAEMGGGVHLDLFHELDYACWLFGKPNNVSSIKRSASTLNINAIDYANFLFEYDEYAVNIVLNYYRKDSKRSIEIVFENQTLTIDLLNTKITDSDNNLLFQDEKYEIADTYFEQMVYFIDAIKNKKHTMNSFSNSIDILKLCLNDRNVK
jgi:predicted dehydrogenase